MTDKEVFISNGTRPLWQKIVAAAMYTASIYFVYLFFSNYSSHLVEQNHKAVASPLQVAIILFAVAVWFSMVIHYHFDIANKRYKKIFSFGMVNFGTWTPLQNIAYVAIYTNQNDSIEVNIWYDRNQHFQIAAYEESEQALIAATSVARQLDVALWDARDPKNRDWIVLKK